MMVIGLTGGIASGKSTVATMLRKAHIPLIDADHLAQKVVKAKSPGFNEVVDAFGQQILKDDGSIDRTKLAAIVFSDKTLLNKLESIVHPKIHELFKAELQDFKQRGHDVVVYMAPLLFEKKLHRIVDKTLLVVADHHIRKARLKLRNHLSDHEAEQRFKAQLSDHEKMKLADEVIENNGSLDQLYKNLSQAWKKLTNTELQSNY